MKRKVSILLICLIMFFANICYAEELEIKEAEILTSDERLTTDIASENSDEELDLENIIEDDFYAFQKDVTVSKSVDGNVYIVAQNVTLDGIYITGNAFIVAQNINIINKVDIYGSTYVVSQNLEFSGNTNYMYAIAGNAKFDKKTNCYRNLKIIGDNITFDGYIGGNFETEVTDLNITDNAIIDGVLNYSSQNEANISSNSKIGQTQYSKEEGTETVNLDKKGLKDLIIEAVVVILKTLIIACIMVLGIKKFGQLNRKDNAIIGSLKNCVFGVAGIILLFVVSFILLLTVILAPFGIILLLLIAILFYMSSTIFAIELAQKMKNTQGNNKKVIINSLIIALVIWGLGLIPVVGSVINMIAVSAGFGIGIRLICSKG